MTVAQLVQAAKLVEEEPSDTSVILTDRHNFLLVTLIGKRWMISRDGAVKETKT